MTNSPNQQSDPILTFNGKKYNITNLPADVQEIIKGLKVADNQLRLYEDTLKVLSIGRQSMANQLNEKLKGIESIN